MALVLDSSPLLAALDTDDPDHDRCLTLLRESREDMIIPGPVLVELDYWLIKLLGHEAWSSFAEDVAKGAYQLFELDPEGLVRAAELERKYANLDLGLVDASVVVTCERLGETKAATLDRRHFSVVRPAHCEALTILPA